MDLLKAINTAISACKKPEDAAKLLGTSKQVLGKFQSGNGQLPISAIQRVIDALINSGKLRYFPDGAKPEPKAIEPAPTKSLSEMTEEQDEEAEGATEDTEQENTPEAPPESLEDALRIIHAEMAALNPTELGNLVEAASKQAKAKITLGVPFVDRLDLTGPNLLALAGVTKHFRCAKLRAEKGHSIEEAMNKIAHNFLAEKEAEWLFFAHPQLFIPFGNPDWFRKVTRSPFEKAFLGISAIERMCSSRDNQIVGAVYACPQNNGKNAIQPDVEPGNRSDDEIAAVIRNKGPQNKLLDVPWTGIRAMAVHRSALEKIIKANVAIAEASKSGFPFFTPSLDQFGADKRFGKLAASAGIPVRLDLAVHCVPWAIQPVIARPETTAAKG